MTSEYGIATELLKQSIVIKWYSLFITAPVSERAWFNFLTNPRRPTKITCGVDTTILCRLSHTHWLRLFSGRLRRTKWLAQAGDVFSKPLLRPTWCFCATSPFTQICWGSPTGRLHKRHVYFFAWPRARRSHGGTANHAATCIKNQPSIWSWFAIPWEQQTRRNLWRFDRCRRANDTNREPIWSGSTWTRKRPGWPSIDVRESQVGIATERCLSQNSTHQIRTAINEGNWWQHESFLSEANRWPWAMIRLLGPL